jgi:diguanylate cyclase (GGDEF)-like protein
MALKYKVLIIISTLLLTASITSSIINFRLDVKSAQDQLINVSLPLSVDNIYTEIQQRMIEPLIVSSLMGHDTFLKDWLLSGEKDVKQIEKYLLAIQNKYNVFTTFLVSDFTKNYYHSTGLIDVVNEKNKDDAWFFNFKNSAKDYEINLDYNQNLGSSLIMFINYGVMDYAKQFIGVTGIGIELLDIEKMLHSFKQKYKYDVYFVNKKGEIILFSKYLNKRGNITSIKGLNLFEDKILSDKAYLIEYKDEHDNEYFLNTKYIDKLDLHLLVEINKKEYMEEIKSKFYTNLAFSILVTLIIVSIIIYVINIYQKQLENIAGEDTLTSLANRRKFNEDFEKVIKNSHKKTNKVLLFLIDIDDFKYVNDTYGHLIGDQVLKRVALVLKASLRKNDKIARWGGEEFAILLEDTSLENGLHIAEKLSAAIKTDVQIQEMIEKPLTLSMGVGALKSSDSQDGLIQKVDKALYRAKEQGKDSIVTA